MGERVMDKYISITSLIVAILALLVSIITPIVLYKKQKKDSETLRLKVILGLSNIGAGEDNRYEYIVINNSHKSTYISEVYIEIYHFNQFVDRIRYVTQVTNIEDDESFRNLSPYSSIKNWISEHEEFHQPNFYIRVAVCTQELEVFKSNFFDPIRNVAITESKIKKLKRIL